MDKREADRLCKQLYHAFRKDYGDYGRTSEFDPETRLGEIVQLKPGGIELVLEFKMYERAR